MSDTRAMPTAPSPEPLPDAKAKPDEADFLLMEISQAMSQALLAGSDLRATAECLDRARTELQGAGSIFHKADSLTAIAAAAPDGGPVAQSVIRLRENWTRYAVDHWLDILRTEFASRPTECLDAWNAGIAEAAAESRFDVAEWIARADLPLPPGLDPSPAQVADWARLVHLARWREVLPLFDYIADERIRVPLWRARALTWRAEILAAAKLDVEAATVDVERAEQLAPGDWRCGYARAVIAEQSEVQEAISILRQTATAQPQIALLFYMLATLSLKQGDVGGAQELALQASQCAEEPSLGALAQLELCTHPQIFAAWRDRIDDLARRAALLASTPSVGYDAFIAAGMAYETNGELDLALERYATAGRMEPARTGAPLNIGYVHMQRGDYQAARAYFEDVIELAPQTPDGHWGLLNLPEETLDCDAVIREARLTLERAPEWSPSLFARLREIAESLPISHFDDLRTARGFYDNVRDMVGDEFESPYRNLVGNLAFYEADYLQAETQYRLAIAASSAPDARLYGNLALALEAIAVGDHDADKLNHALDAARRAREIAPEEAIHEEDFRRLEKAHAYADRHGPEALALVPDTIRLHLQVNLGLYAMLTVDTGEIRVEPGFDSALNRLREETKERGAFTLCGIVISMLPAEAGKEWSLQIGGVEVESGSGSLDKEELIEILIAAVRRQLPSLLGFEEAREIAHQHHELHGLVDDPWRLAMLARNARALLRDRGAIDPEIDRDALARDTGFIPPKTGGSEPSETIEAVIVTSGPDDPLWEFVCTDIQRRVHDATGVVVPAIEHRADPAFSAGKWRLVAGRNVRIGEVSEGSVLETAVADALVELAPELLVETEVLWHLELVRAYARELVSAVERAFSEDEIRAKLIEELRAGRSIRNLRQSLERMMIGNEEAIPGPAPEARGSSGGLASGPHVGA